MNADAYLSRIGLERSELKADPTSLFALQQAHLFAIPFENLDIHWKRPITLDSDRFYTKIVNEKRGGFCYELNGLFKELLQALGFKTRLVSARVYNGSEHGPEYDHAAIIVTIGENEYLADVGFGDFTAAPLRLVQDVEQPDREGSFVIRAFGDDYIEVAKQNADGWVSQYIFRDITRDLAEFAEMCDFQQYSPVSHFTQGKVCSIMTRAGRKTLTDKKFIVMLAGDRTERSVASAAEFNAILKMEFGIEESRGINQSEPPAISGD